MDFSPHNIKMSRKKILLISSRIVGPQGHVQQINMWNHVYIIYIYNIIYIILYYITLYYIILYYIISYYTIYIYIILYYIYMTNIVQRLCRYDQRGF